MDYIVITTINNPLVLHDLHLNLSKYGHLHELGVIIVADKKVHPDTLATVQEAKSRGLNVIYFDIPAQEEYMVKYPGLSEMIPYRTDNRRNVGYMLAVEQGAQIVISMDDDNFPIQDEDFYKAHSIIGTKPELRSLKSKNSWINICELLNFNTKAKVYPRGLPYGKRGKDSFELSEKSQSSELSKKRVALHAGLWLEDPDIDAITRLTLAGITSLSLKYQENFSLATGNYTAINSQNTSFHRDVLPAYYFVLMNEKMREEQNEEVKDPTIIDRYGDIWSGFFAKKIVDAMGDRTTFGMPLVLHKRNTHNVLNDARMEFNGMLLTEHIAEFLEQTEVTDTRSYVSAYTELANKLYEWLHKNKERFKDYEFRYIERVTDRMKKWAGFCEQLLSKK